MTSSKGKSVMWGKTLSRAGGSDRSKLNVVIATLTSGVTLISRAELREFLQAVARNYGFYVLESTSQGIPNPSTLEYPSWVIPIKLGQTPNQPGKPLVPRGFASVEAAHIFVSQAAKKPLLQL